MKPYTITCWEGGRILFSLSCEHNSPGEALEFAILGPNEHGKVPLDTRVYNRGKYSYTIEDR